MNNAHPTLGHTIKTDDFTALRVLKSRYGTSSYEWAITFPPVGIYKSLACRIGERCGVRYASHRKGYRASDRAMVRMIEALRLAEIERQAR